MCNVWDETATRHSGVGNLREDTNPTPRKEKMDFLAVSYTHLTLPTKRIV